ncbi:MAG: alpha/beta fold hydrolase [Dehalococcoidia bacterium]
MVHRIFIAAVTLAGISLIAFSAAVAHPDLRITQSSGGSQMTSTAAQTGHAPVNGLNMYHENHGAGRPLLLLHGAYMSTSAFDALIPTLAQNRQTIAVDLQGHGRTADVDRPITYEGMADDAAALLRHFGVDNADVFGYSMGAGVAMQLAIRHPELVGKLVAASSSYNSDGFHPDLLPAIETITPEFFAGTPYAEEYARIAPNPGDFPKLVVKLKELDLTPFDFGAESIQAIKSPTLLIFGDADVVRLEHVVEMFRLRGGGVNGDLAGLPAAQLVVLPGTTHVGVIGQTDMLLAAIPPFLDAPVP